MRIGYDIGGTFTDFALVRPEDRRPIVHKVLTTPADPSQGALQGLRDIVELTGTGLHAVAELVHATTLVTNALIERRGARLGLLTTRGFRDVLEMGKEQRYDIYDLRLQFPKPLVPRRWRREVRERTLASGEVLTSVDPQEVVREVASLVEEGIESVAVCFLHSFRNPSNELRARDAILTSFPGLFVCCSSEVAPEIREYERVVTTCANGYVMPLVTTYLDRQRRALAEEGFTGRFVMMQSSGGVAAPETLQRVPIRLLESGPAAGALGAAWLARRLGLEDVLSFDMGGTTAKACLIEKGEPLIVPEMEVDRVHRFARGSGLPVRTPVVDLIEIGAGGGSVAWLDSLGLLKVGPQSAGADPGPACYGRGGTSPTVTDANLLLGYLNPEYFLGGRLTLQRRAAERAIESLARSAGLSVQDAAWGVHKVVNENMAAAAQMHAVERGRDIRRFVMLAFGGAGPVHAARVARRLGISTVVIPVAAGVASALGLLVAPPSFEVLISRPARLDEVDWEEVDVLFRKMETQGRAELSRLGVPAAALSFARSADMRFHGQIHELNVPLPHSGSHHDRTALAAKAFRERYLALYHHCPNGFPIEVLTWRLRVHAPAPTLDLSVGQERSKSDAVKGRRRAYFPEEGGWVDALILDRHAMTPREIWEGPCIVEEPNTTTVVPPGYTVASDDDGNLWLQWRGT